MYTLKDLTMITGLTDRTLRNYLSAGILEGEKVQGVWQFTEEQIEAFVTHEYVKPAITAKRNAVLYDYLRSDGNKKNTACVVLHLREESSVAVSDFFCKAVCERHGLKMTFDREKGANKVILVGEEETVFDVLAEYHGMKKS